MNNLTLYKINNIIKWNQKIIIKWGARLIWLRVSYTCFDPQPELDNASGGKYCFENDVLCPLSSSG